MEASSARRAARRHDVDWLRIAAVLLLIPYHTARVFNWEEDFYIKNDPTDGVAQAFIDFVGPWHMSLLFLLAGVATWLAFRFRSGGQYAAERVKRLLVPFIFGVLVIVPPQTWLAYNTHRDADLTYWEYLPKFFTTADEGFTGYTGGFTPAHLWFILCLFVFALVGLPLFLWLRGRGGRVVTGLGRLWSTPAPLIVIPALALVVPWYLMGDDLSGQPPIGFFVIVVLGFLLFGDERILAAIGRHWRWILGLGVAVSLAYLWAEPRAGALWDTFAGYSLMKLLYETGVWCMLLGLLGLAQRYLTAGGRVLAYSTEAAYPFYILHQTVIVAVAYLVVQWEVASGFKFAAIACASFGLTLLVYEVAVRRWGPVRFLFGMKPRKRRDDSTPPAPPMR